MQTRARPHVPIPFTYSSEQKVNEIWPDLRSNSTKDLTEIPGNSVKHNMDCLLGGWFCEMKRNPIVWGKTFIFNKWILPNKYTHVTGLVVPKLKRNN